MNSFPEVESFIRAHVANTSHLQARLIAALDTINALESLHRSDLEQEKQTNRQLCKNLANWIERAKEAEAERDDLRDAVIKLVEKETSNNDYSSWNYSRFRSSGTLDFVTQFSALNVRSTPIPQDDYAPALISLLRKEREAERKSHEITRKEFQAKVSTLEAQLAIRELQLELYVGQPISLFFAEKEGPEVFASARDAQDKGKGRATTLEENENEKGPRFNQEDALKILELSLLRNRALEQEVKNLSRRLELALQRERKPDGETKGPAQTARSRRRNTFSDRASSSTTSSTSPSPLPVRPPLNEPRRNATPPDSGQNVRSRPPEDSALVSSSSGSGTHPFNDPDKSQNHQDRRSRLHEGTNPESNYAGFSEPGSRSRLTDDLERQITQLAAGIDDFHFERQACRNMARQKTQERHDGDADGSSDLQSIIEDLRHQLERERSRILHLEEELQRVLTVQDELRLDLETVRVGSLERIRRMVAEEPEARRAPALTSSGEDVSIPHSHPLDEQDGEQPMDLATPPPALTAFIFPMSRRPSLSYSPALTTHSTESAYLVTDPVQIPLPLSPLPDGEAES